MSQIKITRLTEHATDGFSNMFKVNRLMQHFSCFDDDLYDILSLNSFVCFWSLVNVLAAFANKKTFNRNVSQQLYCVLKDLRQKVLCHNFLFKCQIWSSRNFSKFLERNILAPASFNVSNKLFKIAPNSRRSPTQSATGLAFTSAIEAAFNPPVHSS